ncbi:MAG TPA: VOC family protein [Candidatus Limnocylindrales bacterium]|nr:VOC family protein [Candidatus Limnocylindrales bacterium]
MATLATGDLERARKFYEDTLGLSEMPESANAEMPGGVAYQAGAGAIFVYESQYAGTNKATAVTFMADDEQFDKEVERLRHKGIDFMTFEFEGMEWEGDIAMMEDMRAVWFADPDGNIINISTM